MRSNFHLCLIGQNINMTIPTCKKRWKMQFLKSYERQKVVLFRATDIISSCLCLLIHLQIFYEVPILGQSQNDFGVSTSEVKTTRPVLPWLRRHFLQTKYLLSMTLVNLHYILGKQVASALSHILVNRASERLKIYSRFYMLG